MTDRESQHTLIQRAIVIVHEWSSDPNTTIDEVIAHMEYPWDWHALSMTMPMSIITTHVDLPWDACAILDRPDAEYDLAFLINHRFAINWVEMSKHPKITINDVMVNPWAPWNWTWLSRNPNMTLDVADQYPEYPWDRSVMEGYDEDF